MVGYWLKQVTVLWFIAKLLNFITNGIEGTIIDSSSAIAGKIWIIQQFIVFFDIILIVLYRNLIHYKSFLKGSQ